MSEERPKKRVHIGFYIEKPLLEEFKKWIEQEYGYNVPISHVLKDIIMQKIEESRQGMQTVDIAFDEACRMIRSYGPRDCIPFYRVEEIVEKYRPHRATFFRKLQEVAYIKYDRGTFYVCPRLDIPNPCLQV